MSVDNNVNLQQVSNQYQKNDILTKPQKSQGNPNAVDKTPDKDTVELSSHKLSNKEKAGIAAIVTTAVAITLAVLGRKGNLGESVQKFLGGRAKEIKNVAKETAEHTKAPTGATQTAKSESVKMEMTEEAKNAYDDVSTKLNEKSNVTSETIDNNLTPKEKAGAWSKEDRQEYYQKLEQESEVKIKAEQRVIKDIEAKEMEFSEQLPNMSRTELAKARYNLDSYSGDLYQLEKKSQKEGLTKLEQAKLDSLKRQRELVRNQENEIEKSLEKYKPTYSENTQVSMHHGINGYNSNIRNALEARANGFKGLDEEDIQAIGSTEKYMAKIDKEFAKLPPLEKDCIVYRGRTENPVIKRFNKDFEIMDNSKVGDVIVPDTGYSYTAFERSMAENWGGEGARGFNEDGSLTRNIMYEIHLPKGAKVSRNGEHGGEVVMPRGAQYIVKDKKVDKEGCMEVVLEYILPKS